MSAAESISIIDSFIRILDNGIAWFETLLARTNMVGIFLASFAIYSAVMLFLKPIFGTARDQAIRDFMRSDSSSRKHDMKPYLSYQNQLPPGR